jgi:hypothetical protein
MCADPRRVPLDPIDRLAALIPPPRIHRYHGLLVPLDLVL